MLSFHWLSITLSFTKRSIPTIPEPFPPTSPSGVCDVGVAARLRQVLPGRREPCPYTPWFLQRLSHHHQLRRSSHITGTAFTVTMISVK